MIHQIKQERASLVALHKRAKHEEGQAALELIAVIPVIAILIAFVVALGPYVHIDISTRQASYDCAVAGAQSLHAPQGALQGRTAGRLSYEFFGLPPGNARYQLSGNWERSGWIQCTVAYDIPIGNFPLLYVIPIPSTNANTTTLPVQTWKSEWQ